MRQADEYHLYVPAPGASTGIRPGSAIVGGPEGGRIGVDYEGGGASNVQTFEERILHAAGRRAQRYPTVARSSLDAGDLVEVGMVAYDATLRRWVISDITDAEALEAWTPGPHVERGSPALRIEAAGLRWRDLPVHRQAAIMAMRLDGAALADQIIAALGTETRR